MKYVQKINFFYGNTNKALPELTIKYTSNEFDYSNLIDLTKKQLDELLVSYKSEEENIYLQEFPNESVFTLIWKIKLSLSKISDDEEQVQDDEDDDPLFDPDEQDGHNCLEGGTGQWAHN